MITLRLVVLSGAVLATLAGCAAQTRAESICGIDGGAAPGVPLTLLANFGISGCASFDARCSVSLDGGALFFSTSATVCSTGCNPGGVTVSAPCAVPALPPGTWPLVNGGVLVVNTDGGATSCQ